MDGPALLCTTLEQRPPRAHRRGVGAVCFQHRNGQTRATRLYATSPLKLLAPQSGDAGMVFASSFGGGLVAGDQIELDVELEAGSTAFLGTQSATKVYRAIDGVGASQSVHATISNEALLVAWPDPVIAFDGAIYQQRQEFDLSPSASLVLVDCFTSGRRARGELWAFERYVSRNRIRHDGGLVLNDAMLLDQSDGRIDSTLRVAAYHCFATVVLVGNKVRQHADDLHAATARQPVERNACTICTSSQNAHWTLLRFAGVDPEMVVANVRKSLGFVSELLGADPWLRKW